MLACISLPHQAQAQHKKSKPTVAEAEQFLKDAEQRLEKLANASGRASWVYETHITDTEAIAAQANEAMFAAAGEIAIAARRYNQLPLSTASKRKLALLRLSLSLSNEKDRETYRSTASRAATKFRPCRTSSDSASPPHKRRSGQSSPRFIEVLQNNLITI